MKKEYDFSKGRRGAPLSNGGKSRITIYLDNDVLAAFRELAEQTGDEFTLAMVLAHRLWTLYHPTALREEATARLLDLTATERRPMLALEAHGAASFTAIRRASGQKAMPRPRALTTLPVTASRGRMSSTSSTPMTRRRAGGRPLGWRGAGVCRIR